MLIIPTPTRLTPTPIQCTYDLTGICAYTRFRSARVRLEASVVDAGAVVFRGGAGLVVFLTARDAAWPRGAVGFFVAVEVVAAVAFLALVPVRVGFCAVVPEDAVEETVPVLFLRSCPCLVAGRGSGDLTAFGPVAARAVVFFACDGG